MNDQDDDNDLTRIEDLSDFIHKDNPEVDQILEDAQEKSIVLDLNELPNQSQEDEHPSFDEDEASSIFDNGTPEWEPVPEPEDPPEEGEETEGPPEWEPNTDVQFDESEANSEFDGETAPEIDLTELESSETGHELLMEIPANDNNNFDLEFNADPVTKDLPEKISEAPPEPQIEETPTIPESPTFHTEEIKNFAENMTEGIVPMGGNPPYSILLRHIRYREEAASILSILKELGLCRDDNEELLTQCLERGSLLLSQLSEFTAIIIGQKLKRFHLDIQIALADELHDSPHYEKDFKGLVSRFNMQRNIRKDRHIDKELKLENVLTSTLSQLDGHQVKQYLGVITSHQVVPQSTLDSFPKGTFSRGEIGDKVGEKTYQLMIQGLKEQALEAQANAVIGIHFQFTPLSSSDEEKDEEPHYKITCAGNAVWIEAHS